MADMRPLGVWEVPEGLDEMTDEEIDDLAEETADAMAVAIERLERIAVPVDMVGRGSGR